MLDALFSFGGLLVFILALTVGSFFFPKTNRRHAKNTGTNLIHWGFIMGFMPPFGFLRRLFYC